MRSPELTRSAARYASRRCAALSACGPLGSVARYFSVPAKVSDNAS
jgi:hypothetical protein